MAKQQLPVKQFVTIKIVYSINHYLSSMNNKPIAFIKFLLFTVFFFFANTTFSQREPDAVFMDNIHTPQLFLTANQYGYPIIPLGATGAVELHFDDFDNYVKTYYYTYQLCNADWTPVDLSTFDYIDGFSQNRLVQYRQSSIAKTKYIHYMASLPERSCLPKRSGNYLLKVFLNGDTSKLAFTKRLLIADNRIPVIAQVLQPFNTALFKTHQKLQFSVDVTKLNVLNPQQQVKVVALQNYRWDNAVTGAQPAFLRQGVYEYNGEKDFVFPAGKEYRWLDLRSFRYLSDRIKTINRDVQPFDVMAAPDGERTSQRYIWYSDLNGFYQISCTDADNPFWQGDYGAVHFLFAPANRQPYNGKNLYILGQMTDYKTNTSTQLNWNENLGVYEGYLLLKQGYYTYIFGTKDIGNLKMQPQLNITEGNYWETENDYTVLVYYRSFSDRSDELIGVKTINSRASRTGF